MDRNNKLVQIKDGGWPRPEADNSWISLSQNSINFGPPDPSKKFLCGHWVMEKPLEHRDVYCGTRFSSNVNIASNIGLRILTIPFTIGSGPVLMWSLHDEKFNQESFLDTVEDAHLLQLQQLLYASNDGKLGGNDILRIDVDNIDRAIDQYKANPVSYHSLILIDESSNIPLSIIRFDHLAKEDLSADVGEQLSNLLHPQQVGAVSLNEDDIKRMIPSEEKVPVLPDVPDVSKSEYETSVEFDARYNKMVADREAEVRRLEREYHDKVEERNRYIEHISQLWRQYQDSKAGEQSDFVKNLQRHKADLAKFLYTINLGRLTASDINYDAESKTLYFTVDGRYFFHQKMLTHVPAEQARSIKESSNYIISPVYTVNNDAVILSAFSIKETLSGDEFKISYTDINFKPDQISMKSPVLKPIGQDSSIAFKDYQRAPVDISDPAKDNVKYRAKVKTFNARQPNWFVNPIQSESIAYGIGISYEEASLKARNALKKSKGVSINSETNSKITSDSFHTFQKFQQDIHEVDYGDLKEGEFFVYKQEEMDGQYYVALKLIKPN